MEVCSYFLSWQTVCILAKKMCEIWVRNWVQLEKGKMALAFPVSDTWHGT
jgi:hypothetical protein